MNIPPYAKALVAAVLAGSAPATIATTSAGYLSPQGGIASVIAAAITFAATYYTPFTAKAKAPAVVVDSGIHIAIKTDAELFLAAFMAGIPALVRGAATVALNPVVVAPVAAPAPVPVPVVEVPVVEAPVVVAPVEVPVEVAPVGDAVALDAALAASAPVAPVYTPGIEPVL